MGQISENVAFIRERIKEAASRSNRNESDITLVGVTKTVDTGRILELIQAGVTELGENRVQEMLDKFDKIRCEPPANWHMIGHLQKNKVKYIVDKVKLIHSVDNLPLGMEIDKIAGKIGKKADILVEVNISGEPTKYGVPSNQVQQLVLSLSELNNIKVKGLMTVAPFVDDPEENRVYFKKMFDLFVDIREKIINNVTIDVLSMGMTNDYIVAIEEGSSMVRIGTGIFGARG